jgi:hypothetical protein
MLRLAKESNDDPAAQYVLFDNARKLLIGAGEIRTALQAVDELSVRFQIDFDALEYSTYAAFAETTLMPDARDDLTNEILRSLDNALSRQNFDLADQFVALAAKVGSRSRNVELRRAVQQKRTDFQRLKQQLAAMNEARGTLAQNPDDGPANLALGKFSCFALGDWIKGLPHLLKSGDPLYVAAAKADRKAAEGDKAAELAAADAWCQLAESVTKDDKDAATAALERAKSYYTDALVALTGLDRVRIEKRLAELQAVADKPRQVQAPRSPQVNAQLIGRAEVDGNDVGAVLTYEPGYRITPQESRELLSAIKSSSERKTRIELFGVLSLSAPGNVIIHHVGGSANGGVLALYIDSQLVNRVGDDRSRDIMVSLPLDKGDHMVRWVLSGGDLGSAQVTFAAETMGAAAPTLQVRAPKELIAAARARGVGKEFNFGKSQAVAGPTVKTEPRESTVETEPTVSAAKPAATSKSRPIRKKYLPGLVALQYSLHESQADGNRYTGWVAPENLGNPIAPPALMGTLAPVKYPSGRNCVVRGYLKIDVAGEYTFNATAGYDRVALYVNNELICPFRDGEQKKASLKLEKGMIPIQAVGMAGSDHQFSILWQPPEAKSLTPIPPTVMFYSPD